MSKRCRKLRQVASNKAKQLGGRSLPGVLAITFDYDFASVLLDRGAARYLMTPVKSLIDVRFILDGNGGESENLPITLLQSVSHEIVFVEVLHERLSSQAAGAWLD